MEDKKEEVKEVKKSRMNDAFAMLERVKEGLSHSKLQTLKGVFIFTFIAGAVVFGWAYKNHSLLLLTCIVSILMLVGVFALDSYFFPQYLPQEPPKEESKGKEKKGKSTKSKPNKKDDGDDKSKEGYFGLSKLGIDTESLGLPSAEEFNKRASKAITG